MNDGGSLAKTSETVAHDGVHRTVATLDPGAAARRRVVVSLHGSGFTAASHSAMVDAEALARRGAVVLTPQALIPFRFGTVLPAGFAWNVPGAPLPGETVARAGPDDVGFIGMVLMAARARHPDLPVHLLGYSGGARLASHVLGRDATVTSAGLVAGAVFPPTGRAAAAVLVIHGRRDDVNPYASGAGARWPTGIGPTVRAWAGQSDAGVTGRRAELERGVTEQTFDVAGSVGRTVRLVTLDEVGHGWPGNRDALCRKQFGSSGAWSATAHLSRFFAGFDDADSVVDR